MNEGSRAQKGVIFYLDRNWDKNLGLAKLRVNGHFCGVSLGEQSNPASRAMYYRRTEYLLRAYDTT
jgi:hypothetical protein